ncbi:MAG: hypothetical protein AAB296_07940 [Candidatus Desantisbacteria bacterium]
MRLLAIIGLAMFVVASPSISAAQVSNKEVMDGITDMKVQIARLETKMEEALKAMDKRIDDMNGRIDDMNGRIDDVNGRIDDVRNDIKGDIEDLRGLVYVVLSGMIALMGFVLWDRRTAITPVVRKAKELEQGFEDERVALRKVLKGYAMVEPRFAEVLRTAGML